MPCASQDGNLIFLAVTVKTSYSLLFNGRNYKFPWKYNEFIKSDLFLDKKLFKSTSNYTSLAVLLWSLVVV